MREDLMVIGKRKQIFKIIYIVLLLLALSLDAYSLILQIKFEINYPMEHDSFYYIKEFVIPSIFILALIVLLVIVFLIPSRVITYNKTTKILKIRNGRLFKKKEFKIFDVDYVDYAQVSMDINMFYAKSSGGYLTIVLKNGETFVISNISQGKEVKEKLDVLINSEKINEI